MSCALWIGLVVAVLAAIGCVLNAVHLLVYWAVVKGIAESIPSIDDESEDKGDEDMDKRKGRIMIRRAKDGWRIRITAGGKIIGPTEAFCDERSARRDIESLRRVLATAAIEVEEGGTI